VHAVPAGIRACLVTAVLSSAAGGATLEGGYAVVVSRTTAGDPGWRKVADTLVEKHRGSLVQWGGSVEESLPVLRKTFPRYACFVATPGEATREFVAQVHRLSRALDDDPYPDLLWGIVTGYDAGAALRIARTAEPLVVRKAAGGTDFGLEWCEEGVWYSESVKNRMMRKERGGAPEELKGPDDTTAALVETLTGYRADLFVTSGHATERDWQIGYTYGNGRFRCEKGLLYGVDMRDARYPVVSPNPKVYLAVGNCLMGHIDRPDCMALAWMNSAGVDQMIGYTVDTWYGYAGWGCLDYFVRQPGRFTLAEAFLANQAALVHRLRTFFPDAGGGGEGRPAPGTAAEAAGLTGRDAEGLLYDRDAVAFYGDPAWEARMAPVKAAWGQALTHEGGVWTLAITPGRAGDSLETPGGRPFFHFLPHRVADVRVIEGSEFLPVITDDFVLVPVPPRRTPGGRIVVRFTARRAG